MVPLRIYIIAQPIKNVSPLPGVVFSVIFLGRFAVNLSTRSPFEAARFSRSLFRVVTWVARCGIAGISKYTIAPRGITCARRKILRHANFAEVEFTLKHFVSVLGYQPTPRAIYADSPPIYFPVEFPIIFSSPIEIEYCLLSFLERQENSIFIHNLH